MSYSVKEQMAILKRGAVDLYVEEDLEKKIARSVESGVPLRVKAGFDPTAPDLHLGHVVLLEKLRQFQMLGHQVIFLIGDFTGMIGDPSGRSATRRAMTREEVRSNAETYKQQVYKVLDRDKTEVRFNSEWMEKMTAVEMIELAAQYNVARMFERDDFRTRFRENRSISVHEFLYPLVQAYDSVALKADVELGGHDQIFNLLVGRDIMKHYGLEPQVVLTVPLLEGTDGVQKMSKSYGNYVGINESPTDIFGKTMSISDDLMWRWAVLLSKKSLDEINQTRAEVAAGRNPMEFKMALAAEFVERFCGADKVDEAVKAFRKPEVEAEKISRAIEGDSIMLIKLLVDIGFVASNGEGRRMITQNAVSIDGEKISDMNHELKKGFSGMIRCGKRRFAEVTLI